MNQTTPQPKFRKPIRWWVAGLLGGLLSLVLWIALLMLMATVTNYDDKGPAPLIFRYVLVIISFTPLMLGAYQVARQHILNRRLLKVIGTSLVGISSLVIIAAIFVIVAEGSRLPKMGWHDKATREIAEALLWMYGIAVVVCIVIWYVVSLKQGIAKRIAS